jgi:hypothetical protein
LSLPILRYSELNLTRKQPNKERPKKFWLGQAHFQQTLLSSWEIDRKIKALHPNTQSFCTK